MTIKSIQVFTIDNNKAYVLTYTAADSQYLSELDVMKHMETTFRLL